MPLEDKTEAATPRKREEARKKGQVARSSEANSALVLLSALIVLKYTGGRITSVLQDTTVRLFTHLPSGDIKLEMVQAGAIALVLELGMALVPLLATVFVVAFCANVAQVGLLISMEPLMPKMSKLDPLGGMMRMFSSRSAVELGKAVLKVTLVAWVVYGFLRAEYPTVVQLVGADYQTMCSGIGTLAWKLLLKTTTVILIIAIFDYIYQRFQNEKNLRMTKQEVKEDMKRSEGDPQIKSRIRQRQREMSRQRMMQDVPKADVVVTNPTHFAVALKYDSEVSSAPKVLAKGQNLIALRIKEIAYENRVPVVENKPLARALYKSVDIGDEIPADLYQAVAEVLAYVYKLNEKLKS